MSVLDVFKADAFSMTTTTAAINQVPYAPRRIQQLGLFRSFGVDTLAVQIELRDDVLYLVPAKPRNSPGTHNRDTIRKVVPLNCVHLPVTDQLMADEIQGRRAFGTDNQLETVQAKINEKLGTIRNSFETTLEFHRLGAIKGVVMDADGTTPILNLFTAFELTPRPVVNFDLTAPDPAPGVVKNTCNEVIRGIEDELGANGIEIMVHSFVGSRFMDDITSHPECIEAYKRQTDGRATFLIDRTARRQFFYGGIMFDEYRGKVGSVQFIDEDEARFFPLGVPGLFDCAYGPPNWLSDVNMPGVPIYAKVTPDPKDRWVDIDAQSNPLHYCTRPRVLIQGLGRSG
jgi:Phage major capsid protein E